MIVEACCEDISSSFAVRSNQVARGFWAAVAGLAEERSVVPAFLRAWEPPNPYVAQQLQVGDAPAVMCICAAAPAAGMLAYNSMLGQPLCQSLR